MAAGSCSNVYTKSAPVRRAAAVGVRRAPAVGVQQREGVRHAARRSVQRAAGHDVFVAAPSAPLPPPSGGLGSTDLLSSITAFVAIVTSFGSILWFAAIQKSALDKTLEDQKNTSAALTGQLTALGVQLTAQRTDLTAQLTAQRTELLQGQGQLSTQLTGQQTALRSEMTAQRTELLAALSASEDRAVKRQTDQMEPVLQLGRDSLAALNNALALQHRSYRQAETGRPGGESDDS